MATTINPLFNTRHEKLRIDALLRHLGSDGDLREFVGSPAERAGLVKTAEQRGLIAWEKTRGRYELTPAGWCELAPTRRFSVGSMMLGTTVGAILGAVALAVLWFTASAGPRPAAPRPVLAAVPSQGAKAPAVTGALDSPGPAAPTPSSITLASAPAAAPVEPEPTKVAQEPPTEQRGQAWAKARHAAAARKRAAAARKQAAAANKEKARQRAAARRKREEAARAWAANGPHGRHADYSANRGYGGNGSGVYGGGQNPWYAYR